MTSRPPGRLFKKIKILLVIPMSAWLELRNIKRSFGSIHALKGVDLTVDHGEVIGLVGENGAGKSTLMKIMSGFDSEFSVSQMAKAMEGDAICMDVLADSI